MSSCSGWIVATMSRIDPDPAERRLTRLPVSLRCCRRRLEDLVLERRQLPAAEPEPAPHDQAHRIARAGSVERPGYRRPPVDHDRMTLLVMDVPAPDMEGLASPGGYRDVFPCFTGLAGWPGPPRLIVEPAEEQRGVGQILQGFRAAVQVGLEILLRHRIAGQGRQRQHVLAHQPQKVP